MRKQFFTGKRHCQFCRRKVDQIDYKDGQFLGKFLTNWSKMKSGRDTGTCSRHQRLLTDAVKRARFLAILPFVKR